MKNTSFQTSSRGLIKMGYAAILALTALACDRLNVDPDKTNSGSTVTNNQVYVPASGPSLIDLSSRISTNQTATFSITSQTTSGTLTSIGKGVVQYSPTNRSSRRDAFSYSIIGGNNTVIQSDSIVIVVESDSTKLPAGIYTGQDYAYYVVSNSAVTINVLANDYFPGHTLADLDVSLYKPYANFPPQSGTATVSGNSVVYLSTSFPGFDQVVYKVSLKSDPSVYALGNVYLIAGSGCTDNVNNDTYVSTTTPTTEFFANVFDNDHLCDPVSSYTVSISRAPSNGTAVWDSSALHYYPSVPATVGFADSLQYTVSKNGVSHVATVYFFVQSPAPCTLSTMPDFYSFADSVASPYRLNVAANDNVCLESYNLAVSGAPIYGSASVTTDGNGNKLILYTRQQQIPAGGDSLTYTIAIPGQNTIGRVYIRRVN
jgi:hypothetical protein